MLPLPTPPRLPCCKSYSAPGLPLESPCLPLTPTLTLVNIIPTQRPWPGLQPHQASAFLMCLHLLTAQSPTLTSPQICDSLSCLISCQLHSSDILGQKPRDISESSLCLHTQPINKPAGSAVRALFRLQPSDTGAWPASGAQMVVVASLPSSALVFPQTLLPRQPERLR